MKRHELAKRKNCSHTTVRLVPRNNNITCTVLYSTYQNARRVKGSSRRGKGQSKRGGRGHNSWHNWNKYKSQLFCACYCTADSRNREDTPTLHRHTDTPTHRHTGSPRSTIHRLAIFLVSAFGAWCVFSVRSLSLDIFRRVFTVWLLLNEIERAQLLFECDQLLLKKGKADCNGARCILYGHDGFPVLSRGVDFW